MSRNRRIFRNFLTLIVFGTAWVFLYVAYPKTESPVLSREALLIMIPLGIGAAVYVAVAGDVLSKLWHVVGMPIVPIAIVVLVYGSNTDAEGLGFVWIYALAPLLPYWIGSVIAGLLYSFFSKRRDGHQCSEH